MIDLFDEDLIPLRHVADLLPRSAAGKAVHPNTLRRWASTGLNGVQLETVRVGGRIYSTKGAVEAFVQAVSCSAASQPILSTPGGGPACQRATRPRTARILKEAGIVLTKTPDDS